MFLFPNEEMAIPDEEKANPRVEIAFAAQEKQNAKEEMAIPGEEKQNASVEIAFAAQEKQNATRKWQFPMRKSKMLAWKSLLLRRKGKIRARQSSGSLRSEASQGSSTASRRATRASLTSFLAALFSITGSWRSPVSKCRASSLYSVPELSLGDGNGRRPGGIGCSKRLQVVFRLATQLCRFA